MLAHMQCALRSVRRPAKGAVSLAAAPRYAVSCRQASLVRPFHRSCPRHDAPDPLDRDAAETSDKDNAKDDVESGKNLAAERSPAKDSIKNAGGNASETERRASRYSPYGSGSRRAMRNSRKQGQDKSSGGSSSPAELPPWFQRDNLRLSRQSSEVEMELLDVQIAHQEGLEASNNNSTAQEDTSQEKVVESQGGGAGGDGVGKPENEPSSAPQARYTLSPEVWQELRAAVMAGLTLPAARYAHDPSAAKPHLVLQYPGDGGILFLDAVIKSLATDLNANIVTLNAQDIAELYGQQRHGNDQLSSSMMLLLGYDVYRPGSRQTQNLVEEDAEERDQDAEEGEDADEMDDAVPVTKISADVSGIINPSMLQSLFGGKGSFGIAKVVVPGERKEDIDSDEDLRCLRLINDLLDLPLGKTSDPIPLSSSPTSTTTTSSPGAEIPQSASSDQPPPEELEKHSKEPKPTVILQIQDYKDLLSSRGGAFFLSLLHRTVMRRRRSGDQILIVGAVSESQPEGRHEKSFPRLTPRDYDQRSSTIVVPPAVSSKAAEERFAKDAKKRILEINIRHLKAMMKARLRGSAEQTILNHQPWDNLDESAVRTSGLDVAYWPFDLVHRISTLILGCAKPGENLTLEHVARGIELVGKSDQVKCDWLGERQNKSAKSSKHSLHRDKRNKLRPKCNSHEEKLLNGVVDAESITTTFADVHVPSETKDALQTLTSLSLIRPEAFTYGVLATDKIPGLLLYGPPGTGKTMLAKAVARDSGATVLEISGSDVYDMYVGEGEKNVRAIFTLAKKLTPCVVFIDEADAIFCSRTGASNRTSHRELINQFLREWDGMNSLSAFIMIATNRPFDLDDAVLRRLPRRLLVDLPTEQDRRAILNIHLKDERLGPCVDIADIASKTPFYSGSDLKNVAVAAALACVREENDLAAKHTGDQPYQYPTQRILRKEHFDKAMEEISASISEDMSSLTAIRKFDEKYGDRKGRRKKAHGLGFSSPNTADAPGAETGRVRS